LQRQLEAPLLSAPSGFLGSMQKRFLPLADNEATEMAMHEMGPFRSEKLCSGTVRPADEPIAVQGHVAAGRKLIKRLILRMELGKLMLRPLKLFVLNLDLGLVDLELVDELEYIEGRFRGGVDPMADEILCLASQLIELV
jgi:hypothetical protein